MNAVAGNGPLIYGYTIATAAYNSEPGWDDMYHWEYNYTSHEYQYHPTDESIEDAAAARADVNEDVNQAMAGPVILITIGNLLGLASMCCMFFIVCTVRGAIRRRPSPGGVAFAVPAGTGKEDREMELCVPCSLEALAGLHPKVA